MPEDHASVAEADDPPTAADPPIARIDAARDSARAKLPPARHDASGALVSDPRGICILDRVSQIEAARRSAADKRAALRADLQRHDDQAAEHELVTLNLLANRAEQLLREADQCQ